MDRMTILARRVVQQLLADRRTLALIIIVPMILLTVAGILLRVETGEMTVGVVNLDENGILAEGLTQNLQGVDIFQTEVLTTAEARTRLDEGEIEAVIYLPSGFTESVMASRQLTLEVEFEGSNPVVAERLREAFERVGNQALAGLAMSLNPTQTATVEAKINATYLNGGAEFDTLDYTASALIGVFVFLFVFILTSISFLRERLGGTLERLQASPIRSYEIILGYMLGFLVFGFLQGLITLLFTVFVLGIHYHGSLLNVFLVEMLLVITSVNLGIFLSTFARNEFQVLQFIPLVVVTQVFLGGVFWQVEDMPTWLQPVAYAMPLTHANDALRAIMMTGAGLGDIWVQVVALIAIGVAVIGLSSQTAGRVQIGS